MSVAAAALHCLAVTLGSGNGLERAECNAGTSSGCPEDSRAGGAVRHSGAGRLAVGSAAEAAGDDGEVIVVDSDDDLPCPFAGCSQAHASQAALCEHIAAVHPDAAEGAAAAAQPAAEMPPSCPVCNAAVPGGSDALLAHLQERHTCWVCRDVVGDDASLDAHMAAVSGRPLRRAASLCSVLKSTTAASVAQSLA